MSLKRFELLFSKSIRKFQEGSGILHCSTNKLEILKYQNPLYQSTNSFMIVIKWSQTGYAFDNQVLQEIEVAVVHFETL